MEKQKITKEKTILNIKQTIKQNRGGGAHATSELCLRGIKTTFGASSNEQFSTEN